jgi:hypothetical protein
MFLLIGCATLPTGPNVLVLPGSGKGFDQFQIDDAVCRQWASQQVGASPNQAANDATLTGAAVGTAVGAAGGAAVGAAAGNPGTGAAVGSGVGMVGGTATGAQVGANAEWRLQQRYDIAYMQCMYAKGNQIPVPAGYQRSAAAAERASAAPPPLDIPPPPAGDPPIPPSTEY